MKELFYLLLMIPCIINAQEKGVNFVQELDWKSVQQRARLEGKNIFIDCFATWCGPCKIMDKEIYSNQKVGDLFNANFISLKVQIDTTQQDNERVKSWYAYAQNIKQKYNISVLPTHLFFSPDGELLHKGLGYKNTDDLIQLSLQANDTAKQYYTLLKQYNCNELGVGFYKYLARIASSLNENEQAKIIADRYINSLTNNELFTIDNIWFLYDFTKTSNDRGFNLFKDSAVKIYDIEKRIDKTSSKGLIMNIINNESIQPYAKSKFGKPDWERIIVSVEKFGPVGMETYFVFRPGLIFDSEIKPALVQKPNWNDIIPIIKKQKEALEFLVGSSIVYYLNGLVSGSEKDCKNLIASASFYDKEFPTYVTPDALNDWAWMVFEHSSNNKELNTALSWSKRSIKIEEKAMFIDTYANLLFKLGKKSDAIFWETKASKLDSASEFKTTLNMMKNNL